MLREDQVQHRFFSIPHLATVFVLIPLSASVRIFILIPPSYTHSSPFSNRAGRVVTCSSYDVRSADVLNNLNGKLLNQVLPYKGYP